VGWGVGLDRLWLRALWLGRRYLGFGVGAERAKWLVTAPRPRLRVPASEPTWNNLKGFKESRGQDLALTVLHVLYSLDSGPWLVSSYGG